MGMRQLVRTLASKAGYDIVRRHTHAESDDGYTSAGQLEQQFGRIPGMISTSRGVTHYLLAYSQTIYGDVVELGVWQGRNTCFLAAACRDTGNGVVHAIDHFRGNPGKEDCYVVGAPDLSDLEQRCRRNIREAGLDPWVELHALDASDVELAGPVRLLLVDAEHTFEAVTRDVDRFSPLIPPGGLVVFDDYSPSFPQVVEAAREWASRRGQGTPVRVDDSLVVRVR